jgi:hypothetical protein
MRASSLGVELDSVARRLTASRPRPEGGSIHDRCSLEKGLEGPGSRTAGFFRPVLPLPMSGPLQGPRAVSVRTGSPGQGTARVQGDPEDANVAGKIVFSEGPGLPNRAQPKSEESEG